MKFDDLYPSTIERLVPHDNITTGYQYEPELSDSEIDDMIESGRIQYYEEWWKYVSEFN